MIHQTMSGTLVTQKIDAQARVFAKKIASEELSLQDAHDFLNTLEQRNMDLFEIAGLAKAIACFQCSADE